MTIDKANQGETYQVVSIGNNMKIQKFLKTLGLYEDSRVTLVSKVGANYILNIKDSRYAVDTELASNIIVKKCKAEGK